MICKCLESDGWSLGCGLTCECRCHELEAKVNKLTAKAKDLEATLDRLIRELDVATGWSS